MHSKRVNRVMHCIIYTILAYLSINLMSVLQYNSMTSIFCYVDIILQEYLVLLNSPDNSEKTTRGGNL